MELQLDPIKPKYNKLNGQFLKGNIPHNKGKKWTDYMDMRKAKRVIRIAKKNLRTNSDIGGWNKKQVIAFKNGKFAGVFKSSLDAGAKLGLFPELIRKVCRGERRTTGGYNFYHESKIEQWEHLI